MDSPQPARSRQELLLIKALTCTMFFTFAMTTDAVGSIIPTLLTEFELSLRAASAFHYAPMIAIAVGALALGFPRGPRRPQAHDRPRARAVRAQLAAVRFRQRIRLLRRLARRGRHRRERLQDRRAGVDRRRSAFDARATTFMNTVEGYFAVGAIVGPAIVATLLARRAVVEIALRHRGLDLRSAPRRAALARYPSTVLAEQRRRLFADTLRRCATRTRSAFLR